MSADQAPGKGPSPRRIEERLARRGGAVELLRAPAALYGAAVRLRGLLYDRGRLPVWRIDTPVVSVGNLTAGGTGKTPMVAWLARRLADRGLRPGVLSRGYKRGADGPGDEARLLRQLVPGLRHVEDPDRLAGARELEREGVDVIVLDDGFQHRRLARDLDLVLVDATRPWGLEGGVAELLPRGLLRERPAALARADAIVLTRCDGVAPERATELEAELERLAPGRPRARARHAPVALREVTGHESRTLELSALEGSEVDLVSGIAHPRAFEATVAGLGARVASHRTFDDHHAYAPGDLDGLGGRPLVTTAKDAVKLEAAALPLWVLEVELEVVRGREELDALLAALPEGTRLRERRALHEGLHG